MKTKFVLSLAAIALSLVTVNSLVPVNAYQGDMNIRSPNCTEEKHQEMLNTLKNMDYDAWNKEMNGKGVTRFVNESNFQEFVEARMATENGDYTKLKEFKDKNGMGQGQRLGRGNGNRQR